MSAAELMRLHSLGQIEVPPSFWKSGPAGRDAIAKKIMAKNGIVLLSPAIEQKINPVPPADDGRLRVGFVSPSYAMPGGAERWIQSVTACSDERVQWSGVAVTNNVHVSGELIRETSCDVLIGHNAARLVAENSDVLVVWGLRHVRNVIPGFTGRVVVISHGCGDWTRQHCYDDTLLDTDIRVGVSGAAARSFPPNVKTHVVHNGIDPARIRPSLPRDVVREQIGLSPTEIAVAYVGRYSWEKAPLAAAQAVRELGPPYRAVYVGDGWKRDDVLRKARELCPDVIVVPSQEHVGNVLSAIDCFVLASPAEGMSLGLIEAWMAGVPTVSTPVGAVPELELTHGPITTRVPVEATANQLAAAVVESLSSPDVTACAKRVADQFLTNSVMTTRLVDLIVVTGDV